MIAVDQLLEILTNVRKESLTRQNLQADCPYCGKEEHFYINKLTGAHDCKKCKVANSSIEPLLKLLGKSHLLEGNQVVFGQVKPLGNQTPTVDEALDLNLPNRRLPATFKPLHFTDNNKFANYLKGRKFNELDFRMINPGYAPLSFKYQDYVILPVHQDFEIKGYIVRYIGEDDTKPRYLNSTNTDFGKMIWGIDEFTNNTHTAILTEGGFDKISVTNELDLHTQEGIKCAATFGKDLSKYQLERLRRTNVKNLIFMFDSYDAVNEMKKFGYQAKKYFNVYCCFTTLMHDSGKMSRAEIISVLNSAEPIEKYWYDKVQHNKVKVVKCPTKHVI